MLKEDFIKLGLSEEQAAECEKASKEELKGFIPKKRFDDVNEAKKQLEETVKTRDKQLEELKGVDAEGLKATIEKLQNENKENKNKYEAELKQIQLDNAIDKALIGAKAKNVKAVKALLDLESIELDGEKLKGLDKQINKIKESDEFLFDIEENQSQPPKGTKPGEGKGGTPNNLTKEDFNKMSYKEKVELYNSNKDLYDSLVND